jgi:signal transduction histidine kinase
MGLAAFIRENKADIVSDWEVFAKSLIPRGTAPTPLALRDHIKEILAFIAYDIETAQTQSEQVEKSHGEKPRSPKPTAAEVHASLRHAGGFNLDQMVSEYRALRASVIKLWDASLKDLTRQDFIDQTRFNESIDQALTESIQDYSEKIDLSRNLFLGILSHDLRTPLGAILMSAQLTSAIGKLSDRQDMLQSQIVDSAGRATEIVTRLLDITKARLGTGLPVCRDAMDMGFVSHQLVDEMRAMHPNREIDIEVSGEVEGDWDKARMGQVFSNLIGNAVQYGFSGTPIMVKVHGASKEVVVSVHNEGVPIDPDALPNIFDSLTRGEPVTEGNPAPHTVNLGLGLYITKEIIVAHGGEINVTSSEAEGTTFTAKLPR